MCCCCAAHRERAAEVLQGQRAQVRGQGGGFWPVAQHGRRFSAGDPYLWDSHPHGARGPVLRHAQQGVYALLALHSLSSSANSQRSQVAQRARLASTIMPDRTVLLQNCASVLMASEAYLRCTIKVRRWSGGCVTMMHKCAMLYVCQSAGTQHVCAASASSW